MVFVHFILIPAVFFIISIYMQDWLSKKEFSELYKIYFLGIAAGFIITFLTNIISPLYFYSAYKLTVILKSVFIDGLLYALAIGASIYFIFKYLIKQNMTSNLAMTTIMIFSFFCGIFTLINIREALSHNNPDYIYHYFSFISYFLMIVLITGFGYYKYQDAFNITMKVFLLVVSVLLFIAVSSLYSVLKFYNSIFQYLLILPAAGLYFYFEQIEFKYFRK